MRYCLYQEFYKMAHRKITYIAPILIVIVMATFKVAVGQEESQLLAMTNYSSSQAILLVLVIVGSSIFSMEYQNNAILTVLYKTPSKIDVYFAKLLIVFAYSIILHVLAIIVTFLFQLTPLAVHVDWFGVYQYGDSLIVNMLMLNSVDIICSLLIISLIFLSSCLINNNSIVVTLNIVILFMGQFVSGNLLNERVALSSVIKWNPLNMINLSQQYYNYDVYHDTTMLSNPQIFNGTLFYIVLFFLVGYLIFRKKRY